MLFLPLPRARLGMLAGALSLLSTAGTVSPHNLIDAQVHIRRDEYGVPQIFSGSDAAAFYGLGYACVQDRYFQMLFARTAMQGRLAEFMEKPTPPPQGEPIKGPNQDPDAWLDWDTTMRYLGFKHLAAELYARMPTENRNLLQAYADGVNAAMGPHVESLGTSPTNVPPRLLGLPWQDPEDWTPEDSILCWFYFARAFGFETGGGEAEAAWAYMLYDQYSSYTHEEILSFFLPCDAAFDENAAAALKSDIQNQTLPDGVTNHYDAIQAYAGALGLDGGPEFTSILRPGGKFSQGWAVGGDLLEDEAYASALFGHPQWLFGAPNNVWEAHVKGETFDVRGMMAPGSPNVIVGSNGYCSWTATALGLDGADVFGLETRDSDSDGQTDQYKLDGQWLDMTVIQEDIEERGAGVVKTVYYKSTAQYDTGGQLSFNWGPVWTAGLAPGEPGFPTCTSMPPLVLPNPTPELPYTDYAHKHSLDDPRMDDPSVAFLEMYRATDAEGLRDALGKVAFPSFNAVFADADGIVGYFPAGGFPLRASSALMWGEMAQDGRSSANDWPEFVPTHVMPWILAPARGYTYSANHLVVGEWYPIPLVAQGGHTTRSRRLKEALDALSELSTVTAQDVRDVYKDRVYVRARDFALIGTYLVANPPSGWDGMCDDAMDALTVLYPWATNNGGELDQLNSAGSALALNCGGGNFNANTVSQAIISIYGRKEQGMNAWLRCRAEALVGGEPCNCSVPETCICPNAAQCSVAMSVEEADFVEQALCKAWAATNEKVLKWYFAPGSIGPSFGTYAWTECPQGGCDSCPYTGDVTQDLWDEWFENEHLAFERLWWRDPLHGSLPNLVKANEAGLVVYSDLGEVKATTTILSQNNQAFSQFVPLGRNSEGGLLKDGAESLCPVGQSELSDSPHFLSQADLWLSVQLKPAPMNLPSITWEPGSEWTHLTYQPAD